MKNLFFFLLLFSSSSYGQLSFEDAMKTANELNFISYGYHENFMGHTGYGAPLILSADSGAVFFTEAEAEKTVNLVKLDKTGKTEWSIPIQAKHDEMETQSIVQDDKGNYYAFLISYDYKKYRGGSERVIYLDKNGKIIWDKNLGEYALTNNPHCSYIRFHDGKLELRGHIVNITHENAAIGKDPEYHFWTGWLNNKGELKSEVGGIIDWSSAEWKSFFEIENN